MRHVIYTIPILVLALLPANCARAEDVPGWDEFAIVLQRNVFDSDRRPKETREPRVLETPAPAPAPPVFVDLVGIIVQNGKGIAFLAGSESDWRGAHEIELTKLLGPVTVCGFDSSAVKIDVAGHTMDWLVGTRLRKNGTQWEMTDDRSDSASAPASAPANAVSGTAQKMSVETGSASAAADNSDRAAVLRRLMERRQKETNQ